MSNTQLTWGGETTPDERVLGLVAHLSVFIFPILGPLLVYLIQKDKSRFVGYHAIQATIFQVAAAVISGVTCGFGLVSLILAIVMAVKANKGEWAGYPLMESVGR